MFQYQMPRKYKRKPGVNPRERKWTKNDLEAALVDLDRNISGINEISRIFNIPPRTLRRRQKSRNTDMVSLGKNPVLGFKNEKRLVAHIKKLEESGFPPERETIRSLAFQFAEKLHLKHSFNQETQMAGHQWLQSFLERNDEISIRVAEGLSLARAQGLNKNEVNQFYELLLKVLTENDLLDKPERVYNMDETGIQLNNKPGKVLATKGSRSVKMVTSGEKGETMTLIGCCNAVGNFLPPVMIIKGVNKKLEFSEGLPQGSKVYMNKKSAYINTELFRKWLLEHFIANKPEGKVLLILDGHTSHSSAIDMLEEAEKHGVILLCLPSHTTSVLQPLDRAVYKPFKSFFNQETNKFMRTNRQKKISRYNVATLIGRAWLRAATPANALAGFRGSGISPFDPKAIPDYEFNIADRRLTSRETEGEAGPSNINDRDSPNLICAMGHSDEEHLNNGTSPAPIRENVVLNDMDEDKTDCEDEFETQAMQMHIRDYATPSKSNDMMQHPQEIADGLTPSKVPAEVAPGPKLPTPFSQRDKQSTTFHKGDNFETQGKHTHVLDYASTSQSVSQDMQQNPKQADEFTPSKFLTEVAPIPVIPTHFFKKGKQSAEVINSKTKIDELKELKGKKTKGIPIKRSKNREKENNPENDTVKKDSKIKGRTKKYETLEAKSTEKKNQSTLRKMEKKYSSSDDEENCQPNAQDNNPEYDMKKEQYKLKSQTKKNKTQTKKSTEKKCHSNQRKIEKNYSSSDDEENDSLNVILKKKEAMKRRSEEAKRDLRRKKIARIYSSSEDEARDNICCVCFEDYFLTSSKADWIQCTICKKWLHDTCTAFKNYCKVCGISTIVMI